MELFLPSDLGMTNDFLLDSSKLMTEYFRLLLVLKLTIFLLLPVALEDRVEFGPYLGGSECRLECCWD